MATTTISALEWIPSVICYFICFIINTTLLRKELNKRKSAHDLSAPISFPSKFAKFLSITSLTFGAISGLSAALQYTNILCYVSYPMSYHSIALQSASLGLLQLDRLYHVFSRSKVHSKHGYPVCLFVMMIVWACCLVLTSLILPYLSITASNGDCYIDKHLVFDDRFYDRDSNRERQIYVVIVYQTWDLLTLLLYAAKVCCIRRYVATDQAKWKRVMSILHRILITTCIYEICIAIQIVAAPAIALSLGNSTYSALWLAALNSMYGWLSVSESLAVFLMQEHNTEEYRKFLRCINGFRIPYLCCFCCLSTIRSEIEELSAEKQAAENQQTNEPETEVQEGNERSPTDQELAISTARCDQEAGNANTNANEMDAVEVVEVVQSKSSTMSTPHGRVPQLCRDVSAPQNTVTF